LSFVAAVEPWYADAVDLGSGPTRSTANDCMPSRRYTIVLTAQTSGTTRQVTLSARPVIAFACAALTLPVLVGLGAAWKGRNDVAALYASHGALEAENANYRAATEALSGQIESLQSAIVDLSARAALDPGLAQAMERLPAIVKARAMGGGPAVDRSVRAQEPYVRALTALAGPEDTFGMLRTLLEGLESRLLAVRGFVDRRNALAAATPSLWPARGWLTSSMGARRDPMTGSPDYHAGVDIAAETGQPVYATAEGTVTDAGYQNAYGNLVVLDHGFGLQTRYGHLSALTVTKGDHVKRGDIVGRVGATGRATGPHLHYEVQANGRLLNPLRLLTQKPRDR
jgi:murein DD-endopeptidase MepM/ murein hydrolase activator NlpD